jgi:hypothetical protein
VTVVATPTFQKSNLEGLFKNLSLTLDKREKKTIVSRKKIYCVASLKIFSRDRTISYEASVSLRVYPLFGQTVSCARHAKEKAWQDQATNSPKNVLLRRLSRDLKYFSEIEEFSRKEFVNFYQ